MEIDFNSQNVCKKLHTREIEYQRRLVQEKQDRDDRGSNVKNPGGEEIQKLNDNDNNNGAKSMKADTEGLDDRSEDRYREQQHRQAFEYAAESQIDKQNDEQDRHRRHLHRLYQGR